MMLVFAVRISHQSSSLTITLTESHRSGKLQVKRVHWLAIYGSSISISCVFLLIFEVKLTLKKMCSVLLLILNHFFARVRSLSLSHRFVKTVFKVIFKIDDVRFIQIFIIHIAIYFSCANI